LLSNLESNKSLNFLQLNILKNLLGKTKEMKQLVLATAALIGMSSAVFAAEPVVLTDAQQDKVTAGQDPVTLVTLLLPQSFAQGGTNSPIPPFGPAVLPSGFNSNLSAQATILAPTAPTTP
jgi:hypothetical protein